MQIISEFSDSYDPLHYPLIYLHGQPGWSYFGRGSEITCRRDARYQLYTRRGKYNHLHMCGRLFLEWLVDQYAKVLTNDLQYIRTHQKQLRADLYHGVIDLFRRDHQCALNSVDLAHSGRFTILPASFVGSPRYMRKLYQDAMAIVRTHGAPDAFVTVTCNPKWPEIVRELYPGQKATDRAEVVARVFQKKLADVMDDLVKNGCLVRVLAHMYTIEYQKRSLPHAHILLIFEPESKPRTAADCDRFVSAEIPDREVNPKLYATVTQCMLHGPCGKDYLDATCMGPDGKCTKKYPNAFRETTLMDENTVKCKRPNNQRSFIRQRDTTEGVPGNPTVPADAMQDVDDGVGADDVPAADVGVGAQHVPATNVGGRRRRRPTRRSFRFDNRWVVPYNAYLSVKYNCHINVELVVRVRAVKYIYKYIYKGADRIDASVNRYDEVAQFENSMYLCATEAAWKLFSFPMYGRSHTVLQLAVHLEDCQTVTYTENDTEETIEARGHTTLTRYFEACVLHPSARELLYGDFPKFFVWAKKQWNLRKRGGDKAIGRMVSCSPIDPERHYLRLMLCYRRGATFFLDLRTVDGTVYDTFAGAAKAVGYLRDDNESDYCMAEAVTFHMPNQLRQLFVTILEYCTPADPKALWDKYKCHLAEDFGDPAEGHVMLSLLQAMENLLAGYQKSLAHYRHKLPQLEDFYQFAAAGANQGEDALNRLIDEEQAYEPKVLDRTMDQVRCFNREQTAVFDTVMAAVRDPTQRCKTFFLDGPGGTGKSCEQWDRSAAALRRRTAHSKFHLPMRINGTTTCFIEEQSAEARVLKAASLIVWDEAPMMHRHGFAAVDRTLCVFMRTPDLLFGGKVVLLSGDFRQIVPVVPGGTPGQSVEACIKSSRLWEYFTTLRLKTNMRLRTALNPGAVAEMEAFAEWLLEIGEGRHARCPQPDVDHDNAMIPTDMLLEERADGASGATVLVDYIYGDIAARFEDPAYFAERAILAPWNSDVADLNDRVLDKIPVRNEADEREYLSIDSVEDEDDMDQCLYTTEFLNSQKFNGLPPHKLRLRVGATVMLLRNLNGDQGMCNGTRLQVLKLMGNCIDAMILTGTHVGNRVILPRIELTSTDSKLPFELKRRQFPIKLAFAMTINKAQGQSVRRLGLFLPRPVFSHGQLYVALSRVTARDNIKVVIENPVYIDDNGAYTANIVQTRVIIR